MSPGIISDYWLKFSGPEITLFSAMIALAAFLAFRACVSCVPGLSLGAADSDGCDGGGGGD